MKLPPPLSPFVAATAAFATRHSLLSPDSRAVVAVSGGPDSCALLLALCLAADAGLLPRPVGVAHFHHGLRGTDADTDAAFAAALASRLGLPCVIGLGAVPHKGGTYANADARRERYAFLNEAARDFDANILATAHTASDQAETVLMRVLRGTGLDGLGGIPVRRDLGDGLAVVRPILGQTRAEIEAFCAECSITPRHDPSNDKERYPRARLRRHLPELAREFNPRLSAALVRLAETATADGDLLRTLAAELWEQAVCTGESSPANALELAGGPLSAAHPALRHRVLLRAVRQVSRDTKTADEAATSAFVEALDSLLERGNGAVTLPGAITARFAGDLLRFERPHIPPVQFSSLLPLPGSIALPGANRILTSRRLGPGEAPIRERHAQAADIAPAAVRGTIGDGSEMPETATLIVRDARPGDRMAPLGMGGRTRLLRDMMAEAKWVPERRESAPVVVHPETGEILWIIGLAQSEATRVSGEMAGVWRLEAVPSSG